MNYAASLAGPALPAPPAPPVAPAAAPPPVAPAAPAPPVAPVAPAPPVAAAPPAAPVTMRCGGILPTGNHCKNTFRGVPILNPRCCRCIREGR